MLNIATPILNFNRAHVAGPSWRGMFEKPEELADSKYKTASDADEVVGYINFGQRPTSVNYSGYYGQVNADLGKIRWLIAGEDNEDKSNKNIVLYSEEPLMSCNSRDGNSNSIFDPCKSSPYKKTDDTYGQVYVKVLT